MSAGRAGRGRRASGGEGGGGKGARAASGRGLISDIPLCVVIPAPPDRPVASISPFLRFPSLTFPSAPMALSLFLRTLQPISSLSLRSPKENIVAHSLRSNFTPIYGARAAHSLAWPPLQQRRRTLTNFDVPECARLRTIETVTVYR